jgi:hypothetical protein
MHFPDRHPVHRLTLRPLLALIVVGVALALPVAALAAGFTAKLTAPNHHPVANTKWHITVTATRGRQKLSGTVSYRYLSNGTVVGRGIGGSFRHGVYRDAIIWPGEAIGHPLTFQVVVTTRYGTDYVNWFVQVRG